MFDRNQTGSIDVYEFGDLFNYINQWKTLFESIDRDRSGYIEFGELSQGMRVKSKNKGAFDFVSDLYDQNSSGTIDLNEFQQLFDYINQWKAVFESFDADRSGRIEQNELNQGKIFILSGIYTGDCTVRPFCHNCR
jgi:Ca2+-binding EF-hand superfamily protein